MNRGVFHGSLVQQLMSSSVNNNMMPPLEQTFTLPSSPMFFQYPQPSNNVHPLMNNLCHASLDSPESWTQIFMSGIGGNEEKYMSNAPNFQTKNMMENWQDQVMYSSEAAHNIDGVKQGYSGAEFMYNHKDNEKIQQESSNKCPWNQVMLTNSSSPTSCLNSSFSSNNMMDFSNNNKERGHQQQENSSECNSTSTGAPFKKARIQVSSSPQLSTFKVKKEKMGDRITALHQLISPFGKTDTASVLLEAIGYIRFLHGQIEALSSPYLGTGSGNNRQSAHGNQMACLFTEEPGQLLNESGIKKRRHEDQQDGNDDVKKDLKSRGLCLVPISFTLHAGSENGADFWAPMAFGGGF